MREDDPQHTQEMDSLPDAEESAAGETAYERGMPASAEERVVDLGRAVDVVTMRIREARQLVQVAESLARDVRELLQAGRRIEAVQHAVVGAHVQHRRARLVGQDEGGDGHRPRR